MTAVDPDRQHRLEVARGDRRETHHLTEVVVMHQTYDHWAAKDPELAAALAFGDARFPDRVPPDGQRPPWQPEVDVDPETGHAFGDPEGLLTDLRNGAWLDRQDFPPLRYHLPGIVPEGFSLLVGPPKIGKSWLVLALALAIACGGRALDLPVEQRPTLYLALEDGHRRLQDRCRKLLHGAPIPEGFEYLTRAEPGRVLTTIRTWMERYPDAEPLVVLDTLGKVMPPALPGESVYGRDYRIGDALKRTVDEHPGAAVLTNHHDRKANADDFVDRVSGTNGLAGSADTVVVLARQRHEASGLVSVTGRDVAEGEYAVRFDGTCGLWSLDGDDLSDAAAQARQRRVSEGLDERSRSVIDYVNEHPDGVRYSDIKQDLGEAEARYLSRLAEAGRIARPSRGLYIPVSEVSEVSGSDGRAALHPVETDTTDTTDTLIGADKVVEMFEEDTNQ